ncbi:hypothetical protein H2199_001172 [Coniosporium tulheliwenetii]|uniref:Uncharacterized protein n=1 Tax=Coniosporium tulheliwenetii TaxID=3383036 RepID=A0ACC2ZL69_9PEZI|nr:hypothetical protein H2199_001172 [Cladosporium sp. JES 115]
MSTTSSPPPLRFTGSKYLVQRLVLSTLTGRPIRISQIRSNSTTSPGLLPHEISFLRLLDTITNGSLIEFSMTGTTLLYRPGLLTGSAQGYGADTSGVLKHELPANARAAKAALNVLFTGAGVITSSTPSTGDISVDTVRTAILPLYRNFGIENNIELRILRRSNPGPGNRGGGGEVQLLFGHQVRLPKTVHLLNAGRIKSIKGVAYATGVSAANNARMIEAARGVLNPFVANTYIFSDVSSAPLVPDTSKTAQLGARRKIGVGFGISLVAESSTGALWSADVASPAEGAGYVSAVAAPTVLTLMAMGSEDVGRVKMGRDVLGTEEVISLARDLRAFGASGWGLRDADEDEQGDVVVSVVGRGVGNVGRKIA